MAVCRGGKQRSTHPRRLTADVNRSGRHLKARGRVAQARKLCNCVPDEAVDLLGLDPIQMEWDQHTDRRPGHGRERYRRMTKDVMDAVK
jgi:hypothetical protein